MLMHVRVINPSRSFRKWIWKAFQAWFTKQRLLKQKEIQHTLLPPSQTFLGFLGGPGMFHVLVYQSVLAILNQDPGHSPSLPGLQWNLSNFSKKISQIQNMNLWNIFGVTMITFAIKLNNFGSIWLWNDLFGLKCHIPMFQSPVWGGGRSDIAI